MKSLKKIMFFAIIAFALTLTSSCSSNDSDDDKNPTNQAEYIKFKYDGKAYSFEPGIIISESFSIRGSEGIDDNFKRITLWMPLEPTVGNHPVVFDLSKLTTTYQISFDMMPEFTNVSATAGTIKITVNNDKKMEGTFSFSGTNKGKNFEVTEGSFSISKF